MSKAWTWTGRFADVVQIGTAAMPEWVWPWIRSAVIAGVIAIVRWLAGLFSGVDAFYLWIGSAVVVLAAVWSAVGLKLLLRNEATTERASAPVLSLENRASEAAKKVIRLDYEDWTPIMGLPWYVVFFRGNFFAVMDFDAYEYYDKALNDHERQVVKNQWRTSKRYPLHWTKQMVYDLVPVYLDPEGYGWRKTEIQAQPDPAKQRLKSDRPDVWSFFLGEPDYASKYPGRLPYETTARAASPPPANE